MRTAVIARESRAKECCKTQGNLAIKEVNKDNGNVILTCKVCGVNHYVMKAKGMKSPITLVQTAPYSGPAPPPLDPLFSTVTLIGVGVPAED